MSIGSKSGQRRSAAQWAELIERWKASGLGSAQFAEREGLKRGTLLWWSYELRRRARRDAGSGGQSGTTRPMFARVHVAQDSRHASEDSCLEVLAHGGRTVRVQGAVDPEALRTVLQVVESC